MIYLSEAPTQETSALDEDIRTPAVPKSNPVVSKDRIKTASERQLTRTARFSAAYRDALKKFRGGQYNESIAILRWLLEQRPDHPLASNCHYWIGESYFGLGDYSQAHAAFKRVGSYSGSPKKRDARVMMNRAYSKLKQQQRPRTVRTSLNGREVSKKTSGKTAPRSKSI